MATYKVKPCKNGVFHGIICLESEDEFGFFKSEEDIRPSSCTWIKKEMAEWCYCYFTEKKQEGGNGIHPQP